MADQTKYSVSDSLGSNPSIISNPGSSIAPAGKSRSMPTLHRCTYAGCAKEFDRRYNLKCHQRIHSDEKPYRCHHENCSRSFRWKSSLNHHLMSLDHATPAARLARRQGIRKQQPQHAKRTEHVIKGIQAESILDETHQNFIPIQPSSSSSQPAQRNSSNKSAQRPHARGHKSLSAPVSSSCGKSKNKPTRQVAKCTEQVDKRTGCGLKVQSHVQKPNHVKSSGSIHSKLSGQLSPLSSNTAASNADLTCNEIENFSPVASGVASQSNNWGRPSSGLMRDDSSISLASYPGSADPTLPTPFGTAASQSESMCLPIPLPLPLFGQHMHMAPLTPESAMAMNIDMQSSVFNGLHQAIGSPITPEDVTFGDFEFPIDDNPGTSSSTIRTEVEGTVGQEQTMYAGFPFDGLEADSLADIFATDFTDGTLDQEGRKFDQKLSGFGLSAGNGLESAPSFVSGVLNGDDLVFELLAGGPDLTQSLGLVK